MQSHISVVMCIACDKIVKVVVELSLHAGIVDFENRNANVYCLD